MDLCIFLFYITVLLSTVIPALSSRVLKTGFRIPDDLEKVYAEELNHDLLWDDDTDGSYDLSSSSAEQSYPVFKKSAIKTRFQTVKNALAFRAATKSPKPRIPTIHDESPFFLDQTASRPNFFVKVFSTTPKPEDVTESEEDEVEIVLGQNKKKSSDTEDDDYETTEEPETEDENEENTDENEEEASEEKDVTEGEETEAETEATKVVTTTTAQPTTKWTVRPTTRRPARLPRPIKTAPRQTTPPSTTAVHTIVKGPPAPPMLKAEPPMHIAGPIFDIIHKEKRAEDSVQTRDSHSNSIVMPVVFACLGSVLFAGVVAYAVRRRNNSKRKPSYHDDTIGYGVTGPLTRSPQLDLNGERLLAKAVETYHYQQKKNSILSSSSSGSGSVVINDHKRIEHSDYDTENEEDEAEGDEYGDYTVYECPGLAPPGDFEVVNPLFADQNESVIEIVTED